MTQAEARKELAALLELDEGAPWGDIVDHARGLALMLQSARAAARVKGDRIDRKDAAIIECVERLRNARWE